MGGSVDRILFIGLDGATKTVLAPMFDRGIMPSLQALWQRSAQGSLFSTLPMVTPVAWTSFLTGCEPDRHGIHEFFRLDADRRGFRINTAADIKVPTLWQILGATGRKVVSINLPMTYPAPVFPGLVIGGNDAPDHQQAIACCPSFASRLTALAPGFTTRNLWKTRPRTTSELEATCRKTDAQFQSLVAAAMLADAEVDWAALMVQFQNLDGLLHRAWPELDLDGASCPDRSAVRIVERTLRTLDEACGRLLELADKRGAAVVALSDHGFGPCRSIINVNGLLQAGGYQRRLSYGTRFQYRFHRLADRWRRFQGRRGAGAVPGSLSRSVAGEVGCNWNRTVAFAPFGQLSACVFLNLQQIQNASKVDSLRTEIAEYLTAATHPETGERLFAQAFDVARRYGYDPAEWGIPDILAGSVDGIQAQAKWHPRSKALIGQDLALPATHYREGVIAIQAPGLNPSLLIQGTISQVAPTVLGLLGLPIPPVMQSPIVGPALAPLKTDTNFSPRDRASTFRIDPPAPFTPTPHPGEVRTA
jgi:predicted AlkP superfamily phosphohydrolase/phosphomutase